MQFELGKRYRVIRPKTEAERNEAPIWTKFMDKYDGKILYCVRIENNCALLSEDPNNKFSGHYYNFHWVEPVESKNDSLDFFRKVLGGF